jgi:ribosomal protein L37AE/L43A
MKVPSRTMSRPCSIVCPACGRGELGNREHRLDGCDLCGCVFDGAIVGTLEQIAALPDALGKHGCGCGHPEMRSLPGGVFHCPACGSEVIPLEAGSILSEPAIRDEAFRFGCGHDRTGNGRYRVRRAGREAA